MIEKKDIAILVVLYNEQPPSYIFDNIGCEIIIIDNTPKRSLAIKGDNIVYLPLKRNLGIACALNVGMKKAISMGKQWAITMDQDSILPQNMLEAYIDYVNTTPDRVGVVSPLINMYDGENRTPKDIATDVKEALTSGSMINTVIFLEVGGFKEEMFIDVDFEFCWNVRRHGYKVVQLRSVVMQHHLGDTIEYKLFGKHLFYVTNHNKLRQYYMARNMLYLHNIYPEFRPSKLRSLYSWSVGIVKIIFFEKDRRKKIKAMLLGYKDYKNGTMGECPYNF